MNCPHCQKELPDNLLASICPHCRQALPTPIFQSAWVDWKKIILLSFAPAMLCLLSMIMRLQIISVLVGIFGSLGGGLFSARLLMAGFNLTGVKRNLVHFLAAIILSGLNCSFCFLGCTSGAAITGHGF